MIYVYAYLCIDAGYRHGSVLTADPVHGQFWQFQEVLSQA